MTLAGFWHGAVWNFIAWGALHGLGLLIARQFNRTLPHALTTLLTFTTVCLLWIPFRAADMGETTAMLTGLFTLEGYAPVDLSPTILALITIGLAMNWLPLRWLTNAQTILAKTSAIAQALILATGIWLLFAAAQDGVAPFIYFQF